MSWLRQVLATVLLVAVAAGGFAAWQAYRAEFASGDSERALAAQSGTPVRVVAAERRLLDSRVEAVGTTLARQAIEIVPLASGRVVDILFEAGQVVAAGAPLVRLDDDIERADLAEAEALMSEMEVALDRARRLRTTAAVSQATIDQLVAERATAKARVDRAARRLADRLVVAPFAGTVGLRRIDVGARVDDETVLTTLDDLSAMEIAFQLPERLFGQVIPGQPLEARGAAFPDRVFTGVVETIDSRIDAATRSFAVRARLPNPDRSLPAGMFVHLDLVVRQRSALVVPEEAIVVVGDRAHVFTVVNDRARRTEVVLGQREAGIVEIAAGLAEGTVVVVGGLQRVRDGVPVSVSGPDADAAPVATGPAAEERG